MSIWAHLKHEADQYATHFQREEKKHREGRQFVSIFEPPVDDDECVGEKRYQMAVQQLDQFSLTRTFHQIQAHNAMLQICCPHVYGSDFLRCRPNLLRQFEITEFKLGTMMLFPRRFGKTTAVAMFLATLLHVCRGIKIVVVSPTQDVSNMLLSATRAFFYEIAGAEERTVTNQAKFFSVCYLGEAHVSTATLLSNGRVNSISARAPTVQGNKGITANLVIMDEASRVDESFTSEVIAPLFTKNHTNLIGISTALGANNYFSKFFTDTTGRYDEFFLRFRIDLKCEDCRQNEVEKCTHKLHLMPHWMSSNNHKRAKLFMPNQDMFDQEVMGSIVDTDQGGVFSKRWLNQWRQRESWPLPQLLHTLTFVDTCGGGSNEMALVTVTFDERKSALVVVGAASFVSQSPDQDAAMLQDYFEVLRYHEGQKPFTRNFMAIESNFGGNMVHYYQQLASEVCPLSQVNNNKSLGVTTTQTNKASGVTVLSANLNDNAVHWGEPFVTCRVNPNKPSQPVNPVHVKERLLRQLANIQRTFRHGWSFSGKNKGPDPNDDLAIALIMGVYWYRSVFNSH